MPDTFTVERRNQPDRTPQDGPLMMTPAINEDYWAYRVRLTDQQAIVAFPKFLTLGIGFAIEDDWNTNFPYTCDATEIYEHIADNKGDDAITREQCIEAIQLIQDAIKADVAAVATEAPLGCRNCGDTAGPFDPTTGLCENCLPGGAA